MKFNFFIIILNILNIHSTFANSCSSGYYYNGNSCVACPGGHYCPIGDQPKKCPKGTISHQFVSDRTKCVFCSTGYYNDMEGQIECKVCPQGHFCPTTDKHVPCPVGFVNQEFVSDRTTCFRCKEGYYNDEIGQYQCKKCPDGHFCPTSDTVFPCPVGTRSNEYVSDRTQCIQCSSGYYADEEGLPSCKACPEGHYCPTPDIVLPCPPGTVSNYFVSDRISCSRCKAGYYNDQPGLTTCKACPEGHYCPTSDIVLPCPPGTASNYFVSDRTLCSSCKSGYYNTIEGQTSCLLCPAGYYCPKPDECPKKCPSQHNSQSGSFHSSNCFNCNCTVPNNVACSPGQTIDPKLHCHLGYVNIDQSCKECEPGHYCPRDGQSQLKCSPGFVNYFPITNRISCMRCPVGSFNYKSGGEYTSNTNDCSTCPLGHFCTSNSRSPIQCPIGTVNALKSYHRTTCFKCSVGYYNEKTGGKFHGTVSDCKICPAGYYCPSASECPVSCPNGQSSPRGSWTIHNCKPCSDCFIDPTQCQNFVPETTTPLMTTATDSPPFNYINTITCPKAENKPQTENNCYHLENKVSCECATGVQIVCSPQLPLTKYWIKGENVVEVCNTLDTRIPRYTPIATFFGSDDDPNGPYNLVGFRHAAIFVDCGPNNSLNIIDQYNGSSWRHRILYDHLDLLPSVKNSRGYHVVRIKTT